MRKTFALLVALLAVWTIPANAAGTVPGFSLTVQFDNSHNVAGGCILYVIQAGTTSTPQTAYQDSGLTIPVPGGSQVTCDANGRLPQFFLADGQIKFRLTDKFGGQIFVADNLLVVGPSSGGGGGGSVDPTTILTTGDFKMEYGTGPISGFVRANGRTIGSATSGASERANADTQALFQYLWTADANLAVSGGRGASSAADWAANKTITLPDLRGRVLAGLDDMGNSAAGRINSFSMSPDGQTLGSVGGTQGSTLSTANLPPYTPSGSVSSASSSFNSYATPGSNIQIGGTASGGATAVVTPSITSSFSGNPQGGTSTAFSTMQPTLLTTFYLKL